MRQLIGGGVATNLMIQGERLFTHERASDITGYSTASTLWASLASFNVPATYDATQQGTVYVYGSFHTSSAAYPARIKVTDDAGHSFPSDTGIVTWSTGGTNFELFIPVKGGDTVTFYGMTNSGGTCYLDNYRVYGVDTDSADNSNPTGVTW